MTKTLTIDLSKEYKLNIEDISLVTDSFFMPVYEQAAEQIAGIVEWTKEYTSSSADSSSVFFREKREYNNILAFIGERGTGKTSAMLSVAQSLVAHKEGKEWGENELKDFHSFRFESLHTIDPTRFEDNQNIIEIIVAELFEVFQEKMKDSSNRNDGEKREVLKAFQDVFASLKTIHKGASYDGDALETLSTLASATKLESNIQKLIKSYLKYIHPKNAEGASILIIPIDDFDLNVKHASKMAEDIRKYLMIPQVLVLMSVNLQQFEDVKTQDVLKDFSFLIKETKRGIYESPRDSANHYLLKLIPIKRRIVMPEIEYSTFDFKIIGLDNFVDNSLMFHTFEEYIYSYIKEKTGLIFYHFDGVFGKERYTFKKNIIPIQLRSVYAFCSMLKNMVHEDKKENLLVFKRYYYDIWIKDNLSIPFQQMLLQFTDHRSLILKCLTIMEQQGIPIVDRFNEFKKHLESSSSNIKFLNEINDISCVILCAG